MNRTETASVLHELKAAFPSRFSKMTNKQLNAILDSWTTALSEVNADQARTATEKAKQTMKFCPSIAEFIQLADVSYDTHSIGTSSMDELKIICNTWRSVTKSTATDEQILTAVREHKLRELVETFARI